MKKLCYGLCAILMGATLFSCAGKSQSDLQHKVDSLQTSLENMTTDYHQLGEALNVISVGLDSISMMESGLFNPSKESPRPNQREIKEKLNHFKETLKSQRERISLLEQQLGASTNETRSLQRIVVVLRAQLTEKESQIEALQNELGNKNLTIDDLQYRLKTISQQSEDQERLITMQNKIMETQDKQLYEGYVIMGKKSDLKKAGLLKGGFLKKSTLDVSSVDKSLFQVIDTRVVTDIAISSSSPKLLTQVPEDCYSIEKTGKTSVLRITNPARFWEVSKYLIIQTN